MLDKNPFPALPGDIPSSRPFPTSVLAVLFQARARQVNVSLSVCQTMWLIPELPAPLPCALEASRDDRANGESCEADFQARPAGRELAVTSGCKPRCSQWQVTLWGCASPVVFPCGKLRLLCWSPPRSPGVPGTRSASLLPSVPGWAQPPILRHKTGLIHRFCGTPGMGTQPFGSQKCSAWSCCVCWAEVNKPWWCGQREAPVSAPCAAGSWDQHTAGKSQGVFFGICGWSGRHSWCCPAQSSHFPACL